MTSPSPDHVPVLVVDDDAQLLRTLHDILTLRGYEPLTAGSGRLGLRIAEARAADLAVALVDLRLPDMDGMELVGRLHALSRLTEVVVLTGHASLDSAVQAIRSESFDYLVKPVKPDRLLQTLRGATDRWQRRIVEQRLVETEERLRLVVENISDMILLVDPDGTIRYASPSVERVLDLDVRQVEGSRFLDHLHPEDRFAMARQLAGGEAREAPRRSWEHRLGRRDGSWLQVESTLNHLLDDPRVGGVVVASRDITSRKRLEADLLHSQKMESVGRLAGGVAHDFNNLLTVILGSTGVALADLEPGSPSAEPLKDVLRTAERATDLTRQLLAFSRRQILQPRLLDVNAMVRQIESLLRRVIGEPVELVTQLAADGWPVKADPTQMEQVLMNLAVNARDAMPEGGRLTIRTALISRVWGEAEAEEYQGDQVLIEVSDTGEGIAPELLDHIFEPFFTTKTLGRGTGLGLATVHGIVEQSGGRVRVTSEVGKGTTFQVFLPRAEGLVTGEQERDAALELPPGSETVLLVEDEPQVRRLLATCLARQGYRVFDFSRAEEALELAAGPERIDLLVTDVVLPDVGGVVLARRFTESRPGAKVLFITGYAGTLLSGPVEEDTPLLQKPFTPEQLLAQVRAVLDE